MIIGEMGRCVIWVISVVVYIKNIMYGSEALAMYLKHQHIFTFYRRARGENIARNHHHIIYDFGHKFYYHKTKHRSMYTYKNNMLTI